MREKISACIIAKNEEDKIRGCLESVAWVDELIVVDSFSTDRTIAICREYTDKVFLHHWLGYIGQKNLIRDLATQTWILFIDADEQVSPSLRDEILEEFASGNSSHYAGYEFPRMVHYIGRWIHHGDWYPDVKLRLFRARKGRCTGTEPHDKVEVFGPVRRLRGPLYHFTYDDIADHVGTINAFSSISSEQAVLNGRRCRLTHILFHPLGRFLKGYILKQGFRDGVRGLIVSVSSAYGVFIKYAKQWEARHRNDSDPSDPQG